MKVQIPSFDNTRVLIVGDVMLDRYWYGPSSRISPEAPVTSAPPEGAMSGIGRIVA